MSNKARMGRVLSVMVRGALVAVIGGAWGCGGNGAVQPTPVVAVALPPAPPVIGAYTLKAGATRVAPGGALTVSWTASPAGSSDWSSLFKVTDPNTNHGSYYYTEGAESGSVAFTAPVLTGQYEFRYLLDDGFVDAARSGVVIVDAGAAHEDL
jgi:hypothetical protein